MKNFIIFFVLLASTISVATEIVSFHPRGAVKKVKQVTVQFSSEMVPMGNPKNSLKPFNVDCRFGSKNKSNFNARWMDAKNWVLDFDQELKAGVQCKFTRSSDLKDLAGGAVTGISQYSFSTSGPSILTVSPLYGDIEPEQYFILQTDGDLDTQSAEQLAYFEVAGFPDKVAVKIISNETVRNDVLKVAIKNDWRWHEYDSLLHGKENISVSKIPELQDFVLVSAKRRFPDGAQVVLHWPKGIKTNSGISSEMEQTFKFKVMGPFTAQFSCERTAPERPCNPILDMRIFFTSRLPLKYLQGAKLVEVSKDSSAKVKTWDPIELIEGDQNQNLRGHLVSTPSSEVHVKLITNFEDKQVNALTFKGPFPDSAKFKIILPKGIKDELDRVLSNQSNFPLEVKTDVFSPLVKFAAPFGVIEAGEDAALPVSLRNVEKLMSGRRIDLEGKSINLSNTKDAAEIIKWYREVEKKEFNYEARNKSLLAATQGKEFQLPRPMSENDFEIMGIPMKQKGFYVVEVESPKLGVALTGNGPMYVASAVLVSNMAVHFKMGKQSSLVWVTELASAKPVAEAHISVVDSEGRPIVNGITNSDGVFKIGETTFPCGSENNSEGEYSSYDESCAIYAFAQKGDDMSFTSSSWTKGIEAYRFDLPMDYSSKEWGPVVSHTILDRVVARVGDIVQMKHVVRSHFENGFKMMDEKYRPKRVLIVHEGSQRTFTLPFEYDKSTGAAVGKFQIPEAAPLGVYGIYLSNLEKKPAENSSGDNSFDWSAQRTGQFLVSDFRLPMMKAGIKIQGQPLIRPENVKVDLSAQFLSGGPARGLKVKLRGLLQSTYFTPDVPGAKDYSFFSREMKAGVFNPEVSAGQSDSFLQVQDLVLNDDGGLAATFSKFPKIKRPQELIVEMEYQDPSGEIKTSATVVPVFPSELAVGLRADSWYFSPGKSKIRGVVTDNQGHPRANEGYTIEAFRTQYITHRKRLMGGFYSYDSRTEVTGLGKVCVGKSDRYGRFECDPQGLPTGSITLQAKVSDVHGFSTYANVDVSVYQTGADVWWVPSDSDRIDLIPEQNRFEPGESAKIIVRTPFPVATALVTVEREGVLDFFVSELKRENPAINIPMKGHYAPNVFISVLLIRGRVGQPQATALLDLARPSMKMGMIELKVGERAHELLVNVTSDKEKYHTRDKANIQIEVKAPKGQKLPSGAEVAVAVVDEALLRLKENNSWQILTAMMGQRGLAVTTSSGQNQVIGKRHYGSKAKEPGGGGGALSADPRELFEPVIFWSPQVKLNGDGQTKLSIPLNDSITNFRVVAVAQAGEGLFGTGSHNIFSSKDLVIYSGLVPTARVGDVINHSFTIRNTTSQSMKINASVDSKDFEPLPHFDEFELAASSARTLNFSTPVSEINKHIEVQLSAKDLLSGAQDSVKAKVEVTPLFPVRVTQSTLAQLDKIQTFPVMQSSEDIPNKGGISITTQSSLIKGLDTVRDYMNGYRYNCLEQKISKAVVLEDDVAMNSVIESLPNYMDKQGLLKFFPTSECGVAQLSRYILNILQESGKNIPENTLNRLIEGLSSYIGGQYSCRTWWDDLVRNDFADQEKILILDTLSRYQRFTPETLSTVNLNLNLWKNETLLAWYQLLLREKNIPHRDNMLKEVNEIVHARLNFQGTSLNLQGKLDWESEWHLFTSSDQESLGVLALALHEPGWAEEAGKIARGVISRLHQGHWDSSMANAWGITLFKQFSQRFEGPKISGITRIHLEEVNDSFDWKTSPEGGRKIIAWPKKSKSESKSEKMSLEITHTGEGKPWATISTMAATELKRPLDLGYAINRKITAIYQKTPGQWHIGDVANIELEIVSKNAQAWVVVRDPIPSGASHLGTGLEDTSKILDHGKKRKKNKVSSIWPSEYNEKTKNEFISYAAYLPVGTYHLSYRIRLNSSGVFKLPATHVEAMYSPETFGEVPNEEWAIAP